jgi:hypothetical protein
LFTCDFHNTETFFLSETKTMSASLQGARRPTPHRMESTNPTNLPQSHSGAAPASGAHHSLMTAAGEQCPSCGKPVAADQRYCLDCGQRRGEPRLPFMNAVTFMEAMNRPPTPTAPATSRPKRRLSPNAALITGVGTLLLALGVGVLIGRSGDNSGSTNVAATPQVITVNGGAEGATASTGSSAGKANAKSSKGSKKAAKAAAQRAASGAGAEEVLKPAGNVKLPPATVQPGGKCPHGSAGCDGGEFTGNFFGE